MKNIKNFGSFNNWAMANMKSLPESNQWATIMSWSDRDVVKILEVAPDQKTCSFSYCDTKASEKGREIGMGHQSWEHTPNGNIGNLRFYRGRWCEVSDEVVFTNEFIKRATNQGFKYTWQLADTSPLLKEQLFDEYGNMNVVSGVTENKKKYSPVNILFGVSDYHYDWTF